MKIKSKSEIAVFLIVLLALIAATGFIALGQLCNQKEERHVIHSIEKAENTNGNAESFRTDVYYLVHTDKGTYKINMSGLNAAPHCAGIIRDAKDTITLVTRGLEVPFLGWYQNIILAYEK